MKISSLNDFVEKDHPNLKIINSVQELPLDKPFLATIAMPQCPHCKTEFKEALNPLCKTDFKGKIQCFGIDGTTEDGQRFIQNIGLNVQGFPTSIMCKPNTENGRIECAPIEGAYPKEDLLNIAKKMKLI